MKIALLVLSLITWTQAAGIRLVATKLVKNEGPDSYELTNISTQPIGMDPDLPMGVNVWIRRPAGHHGDHEFLANKSGSVAVLNIRPATKWEMVYLLLSGKDSNLTVITDFNERVAKLCAANKKEINDREIEIEGIDGNVLSVWSHEYKKATYNLKVMVLPSGQLRLLKYERVDEELEQSVVKKKK